MRNPFPFLRKLSVGQRLALSFGLPILFIITLLIAFYFSFQDHQSSFDNTVNEQSQTTLAQQLRTTFFQAQANENLFLSNWQSQGIQSARIRYFAPFQQNIANFNALLIDLQRSTPSDQVNVISALQVANSAASSYLNEFTTLVDSLTAYNEEVSGYEDGLQQAAATIANSISVTSDPEVYNLYLQMRYSEAQFLLGKSGDTDAAAIETAINNTRIYATNLRLGLDNVQASSGTKVILHQALDSYLLNLNALVSLETFIGDASNYQTAIQQITSQIDIISNQSSDDAQLAIDDYNSLIDRYQNILAVLLGLALLIAIANLAVPPTIKAPLENLINTVTNFRYGDLGRRSEDTAKDEIGNLAAGFNALADQIQGLSQNVESQIDQRTQHLQAVIEVSSRISTILHVDQLLQDVVDLTKERFHLYHSHIYLLDEKGQNLYLAAGAGFIGELMVAEKRSIPLNNLNSIVANAARSMRGLTVNDVSRSPDFLPHPLLPETRSELAVALVSQGQLLGVLDVQSNHEDFFTDELYAIMEATAIQIAGAISNARLYDEADRASRHERAIGNITRSIESASDIDDILQTTVRELGKALRVPYTAIELQLEQNETSTQ